MRIARSDISLELDCWIEELSEAQLAAYERVANEHNAIKNALKTALNANEGKELFSGQVFQAYSFKGKVLQELREATLPKPPKQKAAEPPPSHTPGKRGRKPASNFVYLESSDEGDDDVPLAKRIALAAGKKTGVSPSPVSATKSPKHKALAAVQPPSGKASPQFSKSSKVSGRSTPSTKAEKNTTSSSTPPPNFKPSEITSVGGLVIGNMENKDIKASKDDSKESKLQGKTFPSLVVLAKPWLKVKDMSATRSKLDSKVKLVLMLTPNKFTEWLIQEGLIKSEQKCANHRNNELKLGVYSDASKFPYTGGYVWISECCPIRFVSVFHGSIFEGAPHPPSCILKLIYHWSCQTNIQNVVQWVKVDNVYIKGVYTWLRAVCTLAVHQKCKKLGGPEKFVEVGVISLGTTSQDGQQRQVKVEVLGVLDYAEKTIRLRAVEPVSDADRNYKKRFQTILEPLQRWVHKDSIICIDLTVERTTLHSMGFKNIVQAAATDSTAKHTNSAVMDYLRRIVPRMFQNTLSLLSRQMIQQFLDELVWREQFGTYALQAFNNITTHIAEQTRMTTNETLTQRLYQVATNPFKDWSPLPPNFKDTPANTTPKRLKKPINEADYINRLPVRHIKKEKETRDTVRTPTPTPTGKRRSAAADEDYRPSYESKKLPVRSSASANSPATTIKTSASNSKKLPLEPKLLKKEEDDLRGLEEMYYGIRELYDDNFENFPYTDSENNPAAAKHVECPICDTVETFESNTKLQMHLNGHISMDARDHNHQCLYCLEKFASAQVLAKHNQIIHPCETKSNNSPSYYCLICQQRFSSLHLLSGHLQKIHHLLELPYACQGCGYRSSSQRDIVRHFYEDHNQHNFLQCPFCLDIMRFSYKGKVNISNIEYFYMHLRQHVNKKLAQYRCHKCVLTFNDKGSQKQHAANHHSSLLRVTGQKVRPLLSNSLLIVPPKTRSHHREVLPYVMQQKFGDFFALIDGSYCAECNAEIISEDHFTGLLKCLKCNYRTCCERSMFEHSADCTGGTGLRDVMEMPLPNEMHCICGFSTAIGNKMAQHLAICGQKSAYNTVELAQENTVKRNMLDMLGLVRRDGEPGAAEATEIGGEYQQQEPIQFGEMEAAPVVVDPTGHETQFNELQAPPPPPPPAPIVQQQQTQYTIGFGQTDASDIDMPLIGDLADPNPPATPQFLGEVHTPMFDAVAAAEQQHYHQLLQPSTTGAQQQQ